MSKLFYFLNSVKNIRETPAFLETYLKRLCLMEAVAASKYPELSSVYDPEREKIVYDNVKKEIEKIAADDFISTSLIALFKTNIEIAKLIQLACMTSWQKENLEKASVVAKATSDIKKIANLDQSASIELLPTLRGLITHLTQSMIRELMNVAVCDWDYTLWLESTIIASYAEINQKDLHEQIQNIKVETEKLATATMKNPTNDYKINEVDQKVTFKDFFWAKENHKEEAKKANLSFVEEHIPMDEEIGSSPIQAYRK